MKSTLYIILLTALSILVSLSSCLKPNDVFNNSGDLRFSSDTILFDTLFTTVGSTTKKFKIYNDQSDPIKVASIRLEQQTNSMFRINVDGVSGVTFSDIVVPAKDSLFIFVEVTIDPNNSNTPQIVEDKISFLTNGNEQQVVLNAFGQDAYFHVNEIITANTTWPNDKPHVIYGYCAVDSSVKLTIPGGTSIHGYNNSFLYVYKGALETQGTLGNEVKFSQSRTEDFILSPVDSVGGQWRGIYFFAPQNSTLNYTEIKNATIGIQIDTLNNQDSVTLFNVRVDNSSFAGLVTQGANLHANSCLFGNAGTYSAFLSIGGNIYLDHCTFANYWPAQRNDPAFAFKNYYKDANNNYQFRPFNSFFLKNSIIYGSNTNEIGLDTLDRSLTAIPNFHAVNTLIRSEDPVSNQEFYQNCWRNLDPEFASSAFWDFHTTGTAVDSKGTFTNPQPDLDGNPRSLSGNDLGCYNSP
ncbi:hypothetical protein [Parvicella tangerina]|uniref:Lipoprotein n=1 Tax=Parvicella tangerina TaxID=2829795 RepID=A0A916JQ37_9FLAO|nr:hypothetical protein [Parvicella tangerina]CAG5085274.1 hypothetical protein CRYO30217_02708 [Parvicella tangerina]